MLMVGQVDWRALICTVQQWKCSEEHKNETQTGKSLGVMLYAYLTVYLPIGLPWFLFKMFTQCIRWFHGTFNSFSFQFHGLHLTKDYITIHSPPCRIPTVNEDWWNVLISATHNGHARANINYILSSCIRKISIFSNILQYFNFVIVITVFFKYYFKTGY
jgi:hypothetical protein